MTKKRFALIIDNGEDTFYDLSENGEIMNMIDTEDMLNELNEENEQLKQRNDRQYNQLKQLWELIEKGDWETLTAIDKKMKEDEEQLQKEWKCYE